MCNIAAKLEAIASGMYQVRVYVSVLHAVTEGIFVLHLLSLVLFHLILDCISHT